MLNLNIFDLSKKFFSVFFFSLLFFFAFIIIYSRNSFMAAWSVRGQMPRRPELLLLRSKKRFQGALTVVWAGIKKVGQYHQIGFLL